METLELPTALGPSAAPLRFCDGRVVLTGSGQEVGAPPEGSREGLAVVGPTTLLDRWPTRCHGSGAHSLLRPPYSLLLGRRTVAPRHHARPPARTHTHTHTHTHHAPPIRQVEILWSVPACKASAWLVGQVLLPVNVLQLPSTPASAVPAGLGGVPISGALGDSLLVPRPSNASSKNSRSSGKPAVRPFPPSEGYRRRQRRPQARSPATQAARCPVRRRPPSTAAMPRWASTGRPSGTAAERQRPTAAAGRATTAARRCCRPSSLLESTPPRSRAAARSAGRRGATRLH